MTTRLQPTNIDSTLNYTMNQVSANTVVANGIDLFAYSNAAFTKANTGGSSTVALGIVVVTSQGWNLP